MNRSSPSRAGKKGRCGQGGQSVARCPCVVDGSSCVWSCPEKLSMKLGVRLRGCDVGIMGVCPLEKFQIPCFGPQDPSCGLSSPPPAPSHTTLTSLTSSLSSSKGPCSFLPLVLCTFCSMYLKCFSFTLSLANTFSCITLTQLNCFCLRGALSSFLVCVPC